MSVYKKIRKKYEKNSKSTKIKEKQIKYLTMISFICSIHHYFKLIIGGKNEKERFYQRSTSEST